MQTAVNTMHILQHRGTQRKERAHHGMDHIENQGVSAIVLGVLDPCCVVVEVVAILVCGSLIHVEGGDVVVLEHPIHLLSRQLSRKRRSCGTCDGTLQVNRQLVLINVHAHAHACAYLSSTSPAHVLELINWRVPHELMVTCMATRDRTLPHD